MLKYEFIHFQDKLRLEDLDIAKDGYNKLELNYDSFFSIALKVNAILNIVNVASTEIIQVFMPSLNLIFNMGIF